MRHTNKPQPTLEEYWLDTPHSKELAMISLLLDRQPTLITMVAQDIWRGKKQGDQAKVSKHGMTAEQVLRAAIIRQMNEFSYYELAFHIADSQTYRTFCRFGIVDKTPSKSALAQNIKRIKPSTWEDINREILKLAVEDGVEGGQTVRVDSTAVESNIHDPSDSSLLWDCVRVLARLMGQARDLIGPEVTFPNRAKKAKRRHRAIQHARSKKQRLPLYRDLVNVTSETVGFAERVVAQLEQFQAPGIMEMLKAERLRLETSDLLRITKKVISQTRRRVFDDEKVPAQEKVLSIFETHTDVIVKAYRETVYGHLVCLTAGSSSMVLDCIIPDGNPADATLAQEMVDRQIEIYGQPPLQVAFDGGFTSKENLLSLKDKGVDDVMFCKRRGLEIEDMVSSTKVYRLLRNFRAGIEGIISFLKRAFGMGRCLWRSLESFKSYVWVSVVSANLLVYARALLKQQ